MDFQLFQLTQEIPIYINILKSFIAKKGFIKEQFVV